MSSGQYFPIFSANAIRGMSRLPTDVQIEDDEVLLQLSEDLVYRLREIIHNSCHLMKFCCRKNLTVTDVTEAMEACDIDVSYGWSREDPDEHHHDIDLLSETNKIISGRNSIDVKFLRPSSHLSWLPPSFSNKEQVQEPEGRVQVHREYMQVAWTCISKGSGPVYRRLLQDLSSNPKIDASGVLKMLVKGIRDNYNKPKIVYRCLYSVCKIFQNKHTFVQALLELPNVIDTWIFILTCNVDHVQSYAVSLFNLLVSNVRDSDCFLDHRLEELCLEKCEAKLEEEKLNLIHCQSILSILILLIPSLDPSSSLYSRILSCFEQVLLKADKDFVNIHHFSQIYASLFHFSRKAMNPLRDHEIPPVLSYNYLYNVFGDSLTCHSRVHFTMSSSLNRIPSHQARKSKESKHVVKCSLFDLDPRSGEELLDEFFKEEQQDKSRASGMEVDSHKTCLDLQDKRKNMEGKMSLEILFPDHSLFRKNNAKITFQGFKVSNYVGSLALS